MLMFLGIILAIVIALLRGGSLLHFGALRVRWLPLIIATFGFQYLIFAPFVNPLLPPWATMLLYILSMALLVVWVAANRHIPGMLIMAAGLLMNFAAIAANGGHMPVSSASVRYSGSISRYEASPNHVVNNSAVMDEGVHLWLLTDILAVPKEVPFANVYSIGDVLLTVGAGLLCYRTIRTAPRAFAEVPAGLVPADEPSIAGEPGADAPQAPGAQPQTRPAPAEDSAADPRAPMARRGSLAHPNESRRS